MRPMSPEHLVKLLRCPCGGELEHMDGSDGCARCGREYHRFGTKPVIIREERSVITPPSGDANAGLVDRPGRVAAAVSRFIFGGSPRSSINLRRFVRELHGELDPPVVLVVGGAEDGFGHEELSSAEGLLVRFDVYDSESVDFLADAHEIPLHDGSVDGVIVQAVLEHVLEPQMVVDEIHRVLRPNGIVYAETPFMQQVHEGAFDFTRFTESGHRWLFRRFSELDAGALRGPWSALLWSVRYAIASVIGSRQLAGVLCLPFAWVRLFDRVVRRDRDIDGASDCYFLGRREEQEMRRPDLIDRYGGRRRTPAG